MKIRAIQAGSDQVKEIMAWFPDQRSCTLWGGPKFRFPFTEATFLEDTRLDFSSHALIDDQGEVVAFGQYYVRADRCHLAHLVVSPRHRGRGLGRRLILELARVGFEQLHLEECSLFVYSDNLPAVRLYEKLGFESRPFPMSDIGLKGADYMIVAMKTLLTRAITAARTSSTR